VSTPTGGIRGDIGITTFRNAFRAHYLSYSSMYVPPTLYNNSKSMVCNNRLQYEDWGKGTFKKSCLPPRWRLLIDSTVEANPGLSAPNDSIPS
nr:hypothetical protein [Tanacetum cinerariifolium]